MVLLDISLDEFGLTILGLPIVLTFIVISTLYVLSLDRYPQLRSMFHTFSAFSENHPFSAKTGIAIVLVIVWYGFVNGALVSYGFLPLILFYAFSGFLAILLGFFTIGSFEYILEDWNFAQITTAFAAAFLLYVVLHILFPQSDAIKGLM